MFNKPQLLGGNLRIGYKGTVVADKSLELPTERVALDPVDHEATVTGSSSNTIVCVDEIEVVAHVFPALDKIIVGVASCKKVRAGRLQKDSTRTPVVLNGIGQLITVSSATRGIGCNNHVSLVCPDLVVPSTTPRISPSTLGSTVDIEEQRVGLGFVKAGWVNDPGVYLRRFSKIINHVL